VVVHMSLHFAFRDLLKLFVGRAIPELANCRSTDKS
jgi:hypothetical protein